MAGAGYKLFNTGDVLTAAQVNTYLQEQVVMVFNDATARTTALSGVLAEGMVSYLKSTDTVEVYNGSTWVGIGGDQTPLTTKGDLFTYSTTDARLAVGNNGEGLVADSSATTGLRWQGNYAAGKNKIINGDFTINQRSFVSTTTDSTFGFDRWQMLKNGGTSTYSAQTFTPGAAPVAGYEAANFARIVTSGMTTVDAYSILLQSIEDVRNFAGQTATISFWAKAASGTPKIAVETVQSFGSGGSPSSNVNTYHGSATIGTTWQRYSIVASIPSILGKTIGTTANTSTLKLFFWVSAGSDFNSRTGSLGNQNNTFDIWGVQVEAGNVATAFQTATGTLAGELAACQRYYYRHTSSGSYCSYGVGGAQSTTATYVDVQFPVPMRIAPSSFEYSNVALWQPDAPTIFTITGLVINVGSTKSAMLYSTGSTGLTGSRLYLLVSNNTASSYIGFNSEL